MKARYHVDRDRCEIVAKIQLRPMLWPAVRLSVVTHHYAHQVHHHFTSIGVESQIKTNYHVESGELTCILAISDTGLAGETASGWIDLPDYREDPVLTRLAGEEVHK